MPRQAKGLKTDASVRAIRVPGMHAAGGNLYLQLTEGGARSWLFRYSAPGGRRREMGVGPYPDVSLAEARQKAADLRRAVREGRDPIAEKRAAKAEADGGPSFRDCAARYIEAHRAGWKNAKHAAQWGATLTAYAFPVFGDLPVAAVSVSQVMTALEPIWREKTETASRLRGRIESVLDWARARGYRDGENPARWRGHLENLLPKRSKVQRVKHHAALPYAEVPAFVTQLREQPGIAAKALAFTILTAARTGEVVGARWGEIAGEVWTIPGGRMKAGRDHRVPLSRPALAILDEMRAASEPEAFVFPGGRTGKPLSNMAMSAVLKRMGRVDLTVHGFRSAFRDWAREQTAFPREVAEASLAHVIKDKAEAAYARGDVLVKRAQLMAAWSKYCETPRGAGEVFAITRGL